MKQSHSHKTSKDPILVPYVRNSEPHLAKNSSAAPTSPSSSNKTLHYTSGANGNREPCRRECDNGCGDRKI